MYTALRRGHLAEHRSPVCRTPGPPTKSLDFRGFDSSKLLILRGGNSHVRIIS